MALSELDLQESPPEPPLALVMPAEGPRRASTSAYQVTESKLSDFGIFHLRICIVIEGTRRTLLIQPTIALLRKPEQNDIALSAEW